MELAQEERKKDNEEGAFSVLNTSLAVPKQDILQACQGKGKKRGVHSLFHVPARCSLLTATSYF